MYICMSVYLYTCRNTQIHTCVYIYIYIYIFINKIKYTHIHPDTQEHFHVRSLTFNWCALYVDLTRYIGEPAPVFWDTGIS